MRTIVLVMTGEGYGENDTSVEGVFLSEETAKAAAEAEIGSLISSMAEGMLLMPEGMPEGACHVLTEWQADGKDMVRFVSFYGNEDDRDAESGCHCYEIRLATYEAR